MAEFELTAGEALYYEYAPPGARNSTFVFVNALTGNTGTWQHAAIGPVLRAAGYGTLAWDFRGQADTRYGAHTPLTPRSVVDDLVQLLARLAPPRPLLVGLSIGGLFAAPAILAGAQASALVLINTLRKLSIGRRSSRARCWRWRALWAERSGRDGLREGGRSRRSAARPNKRLLRQSGSVSRGGVFRRSQPADHHREFITTETRDTPVGLIAQHQAADGVLLAQGRAHSFRDPLQQQVSDMVAQRVVDFLEA